MGEHEARVDSATSILTDLRLATVNKQIADPKNAKDLSPVHYAYDWLKDHPAPYLTIPKLNWRWTDNAPPSSTTPPNSDDGKDSPTITDENAFDIHPLAANLPWPTTLPKCRQNRHWKTGLQISSKILELYAYDKQISGAVRSNGTSLAKVAAHELQAKEEDRFTKFGIYLFPEADEKRMELLAATIVHIVVFDDSWEMHSGDQLCVVRDDFIARLKGNTTGESTPPKRNSLQGVLAWPFKRRNTIDAKTLTPKPAKQTPLQDIIDWTVVGLKACDAEGGTGGQEVLDRLVDFCNHVPPQRDFKDLGEYLAYRAIDVGAAYMYACVKFSLASSVNISAPHLANILRLIADHISLVNDLASFAKELRALNEGKIVYLMNVVDLMKKLLSLPSHDDAKRLTFAMQMQVETEMCEEFDRLVREELLTVDERVFVEACLAMAAGNVFYSAVGKRYGGDAARIPI